ncbi:MAG: NfeD family protein [Gammaproteobacteria bacterium]|nr:NfeD family protein [Gammaproteobacteria bacterium]MDH3467449.1 NfeD family protein [Gammaproteobacteria bacterium]
MIDYLNTHQGAFWFTVGFALLTLEILVLGMATGVVLFAGIGGLITGALVSLEIVPSTWLAGIACFGISSAISAVLLWKPLLRFQNEDRTGRDTSSDLIGYSFRLSDTVSRTKPGYRRYSGVDWRVEIDSALATDEISAGTKVTVTSVDAGIFRIKPASDTV